MNLSSTTLLRISLLVQGTSVLSKYLTPIYRRCVDTGDVSNYLNTLNVISPNDVHVRVHKMRPCPKLSKFIEQDAREK